MTDIEYKYGDIINLEHPVSQRHPQMSRLDRAAQFAPFAALTGYGEIIEDTAVEHNAEDSPYSDEEY